MDGVQIKDICIYGAGTPNPNVTPGTILDPYNPAHWIIMPDQNKIGKVGRTSWDSFTYAIMMGHNVWMHVNSVQEANRQYDLGNCPNMLVQEKFDRLYFKDVVEAIFATSDRGTADAVVEEYSRFWMSIIGTRGATGKKTLNSHTMFNNLFEEVNPTDETVSMEDGEFTDDQISKLEELEDQLK